MKICGARGNSNFHKTYTAAYSDIVTTAYEKISQHERYSEISDKRKEKYLILPVRDLFVETMERKRKIAPKLFEYLFSETDRIVVDIKKNGFNIYDFSRQMSVPKSYTITTDEESSDSLNIAFDNDASFQLQLRTNAVLIKEHISLKFRTTFDNMDELCTVCSTTF
jgi:hypothetical protein